MALLHKPADQGPTRYNTHTVPIDPAVWRRYMEYDERIQWTNRCFWPVVSTPYFVYSINGPYHQQGSKAQDQSGSSHISHYIEASQSFWLHRSSWPIISVPSAQLSTVSRRTGSAQEVDLGGHGSVPSNSISNHTILASTLRGSGHRIAQYGVNLWRQICSLKGAPPNDDAIRRNSSNSCKLTT